jgi:hypothetical protein
MDTYFSLFNPPTPEGGAMQVELGNSKEERRKLRKLRKGAFPSIFKIRRGQRGFYLVLQSNKARKLGIAWSQRRWNEYPGGKPITQYFQQAVVLSRNITLFFLNQANMSPRKCPSSTIYEAQRELSRMR